jgi:nicotinate-nucleotide adenylyltransferase
MSVRKGAVDRRSHAKGENSGRSVRGSGSRAPITPIDVPKGTKTVMVYGGTFDPPHFFHTVGPLTACQKLLPAKSWLLYVPAARNPLKANSPIASDEDRVAMLKLALDIPFRRSIWTDEIDRAAWLRERGRAEPSYTIDTLRRLRAGLNISLGAEACDKIKFVLLLGVDQAANFHKWKDARKILKLAEIVVMPRAAVPAAADHDADDEDRAINTPASFYALMLNTNAWKPEELAIWSRSLAPTPSMPASSTAVRNAIRKAPRDPELWSERPPLDTIVTEVARYITERGLYGAR